MDRRWIGKPIAPLEAVPLLVGRSTFIEDMTLPNLRHAAIVRSPYAHARIQRVDPGPALALPGVVGVLTGREAAALSDPFQVIVPVQVRYYGAAVDRVRYVGEPVAVVVARDRYVAEDAAELVHVEYEPLPAVVDPEEALAPAAPILHEEVGSNVALHRELRYGDPDRAFAAADVVVSAKLRFPKYSSTPIETYGVIADYDAHQGAVTIWSNFMGPFIMHPVVARALRLPENRLRFIIAPGIGGSFGIKTSVYPYMVLMALASRKLGVPVKWIEDRREHLLASSSGTDRIAYREMALKSDGTILGTRARIIENVGAYIRTPEPACTFARLSSLTGGYRIPNVLLDATVVMTNKSMTGPNRGYGCQHIYFELERLLDLAAERLGIDPAEIRRRNLLRPDAFPYTTPTGGIYDSGDYVAVFDRALALADYAGLRQWQEEARRSGRLAGIGIATGVEPSTSNMGYITVALDQKLRAAPGYLPKSGAAEAVSIRMDPLGKVTVVLATAPQGQGHNTVVAQIVAEILGLRPEEIQVVNQFDTATSLWSISSGTYSSRFGSIGTSAAAVAARKVRDKLLRIGAALLGVSVEEVELREGRVMARGLPIESVSIERIAGTAHWNPTSLPEGAEPGIQETAVFSFPQALPPDDQDRVNAANTYGFIAEVAAVEIDRDTLETKIHKYVTVHDVGTLINPLIVEGQVRGGVVHGLGGALYEELVYGPTGQCLTATFMDYLCPTAVEVPPIQIAHIETPSPLTPLGAKGSGESSAMTAPAVIANAISDALAPLGLQIRELPITPDRLWRMLAGET